MKLEIGLTLEGDGEVTVKVIPVDIVAFERHFNCGIAKVQAEGRAEHLLWLGWQVMQRTGATKRTFDEWLPLVLDIDDDEDAEPEAPLVTPSA